MAHLCCLRLDHLCPFVRAPIRESHPYMSLTPLSFNSMLSAIMTIYFMVTAVPAPAPDVPLPPHIQTWATFLGVTSALLAGIQYAPQIIHTYQHKVVGALSIPMMCIQSPGSVLMILSIALR